jgi:membrane protease YdiL (CAAX protease family)
VSGFDPEPGDEAAPEPAPADAPKPCWRCGLIPAPGAPVCPHCRARLGPDPVAVSRAPAAAASPLLPVIAAYGIMLAISVVWGLVLHFDHRLTEDDVRTGTAVLEVLDTLLTVGLLAAIGRQRLPAPTVGVRLLAWLTAPLALGFVLLVNATYRHLLHEYLRAGAAAHLKPAEELTLVTLLLGAVQPALVEELFFRYLALGALRTVTSTHAAVWVSAVMFALAHVYNLLGLPWLLVAGVVFGYWRVASGGLAVPILMHFTHNAVMLWTGDLV